MTKQTGFDDIEKAARANNIAAVAAGLAKGHMVAMRVNPRRPRTDGSC